MKITKLFIVLLCTFACVACQKDEEPEKKYECECEGKEIIKVLKDEPAYIVEDCFDFPIRKDSFSVQLLDGSGPGPIFPCEAIPDEYRTDGLRVLISGNVTNCAYFNGCLMSPEVRLAPAYYTELTSIKKVE